jgi:hypothetical protein
MYVAEVSNSAAQGQTGVWLLAIFLFGLAAMAWLTVREASLYETKTAIKNLRRGRKPNIPVRERLPLFSRCNLFMRSVIRGGDITEPFQQVVGEGEYGFEFRLRREIDKLVGKDVYHGKREQL